MAAPKILNVSFAGGGCRGIAFAKAIDAFEKKGWLADVETYSGCSIGALVAALMAVGFTGTELCDMVMGSDLHDVCNINLMSLFANWGLDGGQKLEHFIDAKLNQKLNKGRPLTMLDLPTLTTVATNLNEALPLYCNATTTPTLRVSRAVHMSMCLPPLFSPVSYEGKLYIDGGLVDNLPIVHDPRTTLAFQLVWKNAFTLTTIDSYFSRCIYVGLYRLSLSKQGLDQCHVCRIDGGDVATLNMRLRPETKKSLFANAAAAAEETVARWG